MKHDNYSRPTNNSTQKNGTSPPFAEGSLTSLAFHWHKTQSKRPVFIFSLLFRGRECLSHSARCRTHPRPGRAGLRAPGAPAAPQTSRKRRKGPKTAKPASPSPGEHAQANTHTPQAFSPVFSPGFAAAPGPAAASRPPLPQLPPAAPRPPPDISSPARPPPRLFLSCRAGGAAKELPGRQPSAARRRAGHRPARTPQGHRPGLLPCAGGRTAPSPAGPRQAPRKCQGRRRAGGSLARPGRAGRRVPPRRGSPVPPQMPSFSWELSRFTT